MRSKEIYLDNGSTTKVDQKIIEVMLPWFTQKYGNASSLHTFGQKAKEVLEKSRGIIAKSIGAKPEEIVFTSGGTEANNLALKGVALSINRKKKNHIITTKIEHDSILKPCQWLEKEGFTLTYLEVDSEGFVKPEDLEKAITPKTFLVSIIHGNNEIGTIQNLEVLGKICQEKDLFFHTDACQSYLKTNLNVKKMNLDLVSLNAHKIHGPKGIGALYVRQGIRLIPTQQGGGQEFGLRSGTENIPGIVGFAEAVRLGKDKKHIEYIKRLRDKLLEGILAIPQTRLNGPQGEKRLCNNINCSFADIEGEALGGYLDQKGICSSTGSACSSLSLEPSHVLKAIGLSDEEAHGSLRLTLSRFNTEEEIDYVLDVLPKIVNKLRRMSPLRRVTNAIFKKNNYLF